MAHTVTNSSGLYDHHFVDWADKHMARMANRITGFVARRPRPPAPSAPASVESRLRFRVAVNRQDLLRVHLEGLAL